MSDQNSQHPYDQYLESLPVNPPSAAYGSGFDMRTLPAARGQAPSGNINAPATAPAGAPAQQPAATFSGNVTPPATSSVQLPSKESQLNDILNQLASSRGADLSDVTPPGARMADMRLDTHTGQVEVTRPGVVTPFASETTADSHLNIEATTAQIAAGVAAIESKLAETAFDKAGKPTPVLQGRARELAEMQLKQARESAAYDLARLQSQQAQRDSRAQRSTQIQGEDVARAAWINGDAARAKALEEAELMIEAEALARSLRKSRGAQ